MKLARLLGIAALVVALPLTAAAGGWALTSFDDMPESFEAGETYELLYTILQHGETPVDVGRSSVLVTDAAGNTTTFEAAKANGTGRYVVEITFPEAGTFSWQVTQGGFEPHDLGQVTIEGAAATGASMVRLALPIAFALVVGLLVWQIYGLARKRPLPAHAD